MAALITRFTLQAVYPYAKMTEQVIKSVFSLLPFLWDKNEVESPEKEKNLMDFGDRQEISNPFPHPTYYHPRLQSPAPSPSHQAFHYPSPPSVIPSIPDLFPNMMDRLEQLEKRNEACEMATLEFQTQLSEIQVEINDFYQNPTESGNPKKFEMDQIN
jgi:hypothetical protein